MSNETRVGMVVLIGLIMLMGIVSFLGMFKFNSNDYDIYIKFKRTTGLKPGDIVNFVGVPVGQVNRIEVDGLNVRVAVSIRDSIKIPEDSLFLLGSEGVMGAMYIDIEPPRDEKPTKFLRDGSEVTGAAGSSMNDFMTSASGVLSKMEIMADSVNAIFADQDIQKSIKSTITNAGEITENINHLSKVFADVAVQNQSELNQMVQQLSSMAVHMNQVASRMNNMLTEIDSNGQAGRDIATMLQNLQRASENVEKITKSIENVTGDPRTQENIKVTLENARQASEKANRMLNSFGGGKTKSYLDIKYGDTPDKYRFDANLRFDYAKNSFLLMGVSDIGEENDINFQLGKGNDYTAVRAGVVLGKVGAGVDVKPLKWLRFSADAYDPNDLKIRVGGEIMLSEKFSLYGESLDVKKKAGDTTYLGMRGYF